MKTLIAIGLFCFALSTQAVWIKWDRNYESVAGYVIHYGIASHDYSTHYDAGNTNVVWMPRLKLLPAMEYFFAVSAYTWDEQSAFSEELVWTTAASIPYVPVTNIWLRVPVGKYYVERSDTLATWTVTAIFIGPTNVACPIKNQMGFFRWRPFFVAAKPTKVGKLTVTQVAMFKPKTATVASVSIASAPMPSLPMLPVEPKLPPPPGTPPTLSPTQP